jgi:cytochrome P450
LIFLAPWYRFAHRRVFTVFRDLVQRARSQRQGSGGPPTIVDALVGARDSSGKPLTDDEAVTYLAYGTVGACAYVARLTAFMLYEIVRDQALMKELCAEARAAFHAGVREASTSIMRILQPVYHETLRHSVSPGMPFIVDRDFNYRVAVPARRGHRLPVPCRPRLPRFRSGGSIPRCREPRNEHRAGELPFRPGNRTCVATGLVK